MKGVGSVMEQYDPGYYKPFDISVDGLGETDLDGLFERLSAPIRNHSRRVAVCSAIMAEYAKGFLQMPGLPSGTDPAGITHLGGLCHDIGKLLFPTLATTEADYFRHPAYGADLLEKHKGILFSSEAEARSVLDMVRYHHEQPDGGGFPYGLRARNIPLTAGICAVADSLDHRIFSDHNLSNSSTAVFDDIKAQEGTLLYESAVVCFERAWPRLIEQYTNWARTVG